MRKREVVSYVLNCILITIIVVGWLFLGGNRFNNEYLQERVTDLEEDQIGLNMQLAAKELPELVQGEHEMITKEERIEELELIDLSRVIVLNEAYNLIEAQEFYIGMLQQTMDLNNIIYPEWIYTKVLIESQHRW